ncbi:MAG TPA: oligosaccharide flippase family protein [Candidatus Diapherotrites archaeon]|uniref:Oligosaccharide flippase family protein n=1 Tax=Candidatus Iainarchaeum sp. TaxID=3101447 RepID=A0A7J4J2W9_9ARCH|nr:oligosaccharide flippase family protein [Candidatus Diapherotrites archaeon]
MGMREIFGNATLISGGNIAASALNFITFLITLNALGTHGFGVYSLVLSVLAVATLFLDMGVGKLVVADVAKDINERKGDDAGALFGGYILLQVVLGIILVACLFFGSGSVAAYFGPDIEIYIRLIAMLVIAGAARNILLTAFQVVSDFSSYAKFLFAEALAKLALTAIAAYSLANVEGMLLATAIGSIISLAAFWGHIPARLKKAGLFGPQTRKSLAVMFTKHGKWSIISSQARNLESNIPPWIVGYFLGVNAVGIYSALLKIQVTAIRLFEPLETVFYPMVSRLGSPEDSRRQIIRATKYILYSSIPVVAGVVLFAEPIIRTVLGEEVVPYANVLRILMFTLLIFIANIPMKPFFYNLKAQKQLTIVSAIILVSTLFAGSALASYLGLMGIALNHLISPAIDLALKRRYMAQITGARYPIAEFVLLDRQDAELFRRFAADPLRILGVKK